MKGTHRTLLAAALCAVLGISIADTADAGNGNGNGNGAGRGNDQGPDKPDRGNGPPDHAGGGSGGMPPGLAGRGSRPGRDDVPDAGEDDEDESPSQRRRGRGPRGLDVCSGDDVVLIGPEGRAGRSHVAHVDFAEIDPASGEPIADSAWARMMYFWVGSTLDFVANGHQLEPGTEYVLATFDADGGAICLGDGTVNPGGQLHILGTVDPESHLPPDLDPFAERTEDTVDATVALLPAVQVDCLTGTVEAGDGSVLEGEVGLRFVDTDVLECPSDE